MKKEPEKMNFQFSKPKTLHELLKQGSGQNLVLDFSMLSKMSLIEKAKKYQNLTNPKLSELNNDNSEKTRESEEKVTSTSNTKISKNFEILSKLGKKKKKKENLNIIKNKEININNIDMNDNKELKEELINDLNNKINITTIETKSKQLQKKNKNNQNSENNDNISQECLELNYDNPNIDIDIGNYTNNNKNEISEKNKNKNKKQKNAKLYQYIEEKTENKNTSKNNKINNDDDINDIEFNSLYEEQPITKILNYSTFTTPEEIESTLNLKQKKIKQNQIHNNINIPNNTHRPFVISKSPHNKKNKNIKEKRQNQATEYETIKENYTIKHCNCVLEYSFREDQNIDSEILMEDKSKSIENFNNDKNQMIFEIFDGHGGDEMSTYLQNNLAQIYKQNLLLSKGNIILGLKNAFQDADDEMRGQLNIEGLGSTGTLVHVIWEGEDDLAVYSANVGDSRVCLISPEHIIRLSYDHRTSDEKEKKRILEAGMEIIDDRICGTLMLTRIFGNYEYKENEDNDSDNKGLICEPFISKINIDLNIENQFLILASDGIWDILSEEEIQQIIQKYNETQKICSMIIKKCIRKSAWDNMSIFAVKLT